MLGRNIQKLLLKKNNNRLRSNFYDALAMVLTIITFRTARRGLHHLYKRMILQMLGTRTCVCFTIVKVVRHAFFYFLLYLLKRDSTVFRRSAEQRK